MTEKKRGGDKGGRRPKGIIQTKMTYEITTKAGVTFIISAFGIKIKK